LPHHPAIQPALGIQKFISEYFGNAFQRGPAWFDHFPGNQVCVNNRRSQARKTVGYRRFTGRNAPRQDNRENTWVLYRIVSAAGDGNPSQPNPPDRV
jgi:hypothetical protein